MNDAPIYLDHNASTPLLPEVFEAMVPWLRDGHGNPSSSHVYGRRARAAVDDARAQVAALLRCAAAEVVFTSGGTESNNLALRGALASSSTARTRAVTTAIEHPAVLEPLRALASRVALDVIPVDESCRARLDVARALITHDAALVSVMHSNNETGALQPVREIAAMARERGALVHVDAAQSVGKVDVDVEGVDLLTVAGHKLGAPKGVGALFVREGVALAPQSLGAGHERGLRAGTENVASIVGLGVACDVARRTLAERSARIAALRDELWRLLVDGVPGVVRSGDAARCLPNTLHVRFPNATGASVLRNAPAIAASTGSACHDGGDGASAVLVAMGVERSLARGAVRLSLGFPTTRDEVERAARALIAAAA